MFMIHTFFKELLNYPPFDEFPEFNHNFNRDIILISEAMDAQAMTIEGIVLEVVMKVEGATSEVVEVLAKVPKSPRMLKPKLTLTKESVTNNKGKQAATPMYASPRRNI